MSNLCVYEANLSRIGRSRYGDLSKVAAGQIWLVKDQVEYPDGTVIPLEPDGKRPNMVLVMGFEDDFEENPLSIVRVFPVSKLWLFAGPHDLAFSRENSPLKGIPLMIECWNPKPMLRANLFKPIAKLDEAAVQDVEELQSADLRGAAPGPLKSSGYIGHPIKSKTDPRLKFQRNEVERTQFLNAPVTAYSQGLEAPSPERPFFVSWPFSKLWIPAQVAAGITIAALILWTLSLQQQVRSLRIELAEAEMATNILQERVSQMQDAPEASPEFLLAVRALATQQIQVPEDVTRLVGDTGTLLSTDVREGVPFSLLGPVGSIIQTQNPVFQWAPLEGAQSYTLTVLDTDYNRAVKSPVLESTEWQVPQSLSLERGMVYIWQVTAFRNGQEIISPRPPAGEAKFKILERERLDEIREQERKYANSPLLLGIIYAQAGLLEDAENQFQAILEQESDSPLAPVARELLDSLRR